MKKISAEIKVKGMVQGVGFRYFAVLEARKIGVCGYVKNEPDGSVFAYAEGSEDEINDFIAFLKSSPSSSVVESADAKIGEWSGQYNDFKIEF